MSHSMRDRYSAALGALLAGAFISSSQAASVPLPATAAGGAGSASERGFVVRTVQAPEASQVPNNFVRALQQLNGTLKDATGALVANEASPGQNADGSYNVDLLDFERDGAEFEVVDVANQPLQFFLSTPFPGIPGSGGHTTRFAVEAVAYLDLPAGETTFGVSVGTDRTDVNDDDSYQVTVGAVPRDFFATKVGEFERNAPPFVPNTHSENTWTVNAPQAGIYPFRLVYWQGGNGANLHFYTVLASGERILVNDSADARSIKAYRKSSLPASGAPYIGEISPLPGSAGNSSAAPIEVVVLDGSRPVQDASVKLALNGSAATATPVRTGNRVSLSYTPDPNRTDANNAVKLDFSDTSGGASTRSWAFTINVSGGSSAPVSGQWEFDAGNLGATVGKALEFLGGTTGVTAQKTEFGTTTSFGIPDIGGAAARVMKVPGDLDRNIGYVMTHGISPNGGGTRVNQFTLVMDVYVETTGPGAASLLQISSLNNSDDGDLFWQGSNFGQGTGGYNGKGTFTAGAWHRVAAAYDMAAAVPVVVKYVDGIKQDDWTANQGLDAPRRALQPTAILFGDGDQDERRTMYVNSIQIRSGRLSDAELALLGGPSANGVPTSLPPSNVTGGWDFDFADLSASVGTSLAYLDGAEGLTKAGTLFGTTGEGDFTDIPGIGGKPAKVMKVPGDLNRNIGYVMTHRIAPNGGGTRVNQYTLIMDVYVGTTGPGAASLLQTSSLNNSDDGDLFWQGSNFGQGTGGYNGRGTFTAGAWHRVVAAYDMAASTPVVTKYVDGIKQDDWTANQGLDAPRRALQPTAILFGDGDQDERREMWVNSIQIRAGKLTDAQAAALGGPSADGIPIATPISNVTGAWDFNYPDLGANVGKALTYLDGNEGLTKAGTKFGTTGDGDFATVPNIGTEPAKVMYVPGDLDRNIGYVMEHLIPANGGGTRVNQYTLIMDLLIGTTGPGAASLLQISSLNNSDDGDLFWQGSNFGQGTGGYNGKGTFTAGEWHRVVAAYNMAANPPVVTKYVDGIFQDDWTANQGLDAPRRALQPTAILFGDGDQDERREMWVNAVQIRSGALSKPEIEALGGPSAAGIPILLSVAAPEAPPTLTVARSATEITLSWAADATGYTLESAAALPSTTWTAVPGVTGNSVKVPATGSAQFYRLRK
jgi:hypothetical protein